MENEKKGKNIFKTPVDGRWQCRNSIGKHMRVHWEKKTEEGRQQEKKGPVIVTRKEKSDDKRNIKHASPEIAQAKLKNKSI